MTLDELYRSSELQLENEEWRKVPYLPPHIEISSLGRVRKYITVTDMELFGYKDSSGYMQFSYGGTSYAIHRVVADVFLGEEKSEGKPFVNHKNGIKDDNRVENLEWCSPQSNLIKSYNWGTDSRKKIYCEDLDKVYGSIRTISYLTGIPQDLISLAIKEHCRCFGHTFRYIEATDPILDDHNILYIEYKVAAEIGYNSSSVEEMRRKCQEYVGEGIRRP